MKDTIKELVRSTIISICMAMTIFCIVGIVFDQVYKGHFSLENYGFTKMVVGCVVVGSGFGVPTVVYNNDSLPMPIKVLIHMGIGCAVYTITAFAVGWIGGANSIGLGIVIALIQLAVAFVIWFAFFKYYKKEAFIMNERIKELRK